MKKSNRLIVGTALGLAAIAVAIDHTKHRLPDPVAAEYEQNTMNEEESPCGMGEESSPCSMDTEMDSDDADSSPCGLGD